MTEAWAFDLLEGFWGEIANEGLVGRVGDDRVVGSEVGGYGVELGGVARDLARWLGAVAHQVGHVEQGVRGAEEGRLRH